MNKLAIHPGFILALFLVIIASCQAQVNEKNKKIMETKIDNMFINFQNEKFREDTNLAPQSGWLMTLSSGRKVSRSFLMFQADTIITFGKNAVPHLFKWVMNDNLSVRYIAIYSLQQITGLEPFTPYFDQEDAENNREKAIAIWKEWWENNKNKI